MTHRLCSTVVALLFLVVISILASHTCAIKCYVCGEGADRPFVESTNINQSLVERIQSSCDGFHSNLTPQEREKYAFECPTEYKGCSIVVGVNVVRTCFQFTIQDCKNFNSYRYCYCHNKDLCNKEDIKPTQEMLGQLDKTTGSIDDEDGDDESEDEESGDYGDNESTSRESHQHESTTINKIISRVNGINQESTLTTSTLPTVNRAVNFNLPVHFLILMSLINISVAICYSNYNLS